ncbi:glycosyltransferase family 2 protein [Aliiroseovarius halocynthiae]|uniref:glycosyltransferase family 2 protein n=1 Tax=Aliiroseovarius halocynthiae TaxID=985055 RepID=UPI0039089ED6
MEWLAYHRSIGFTDFLIYTNDCRDGTDLLLDRLDANGIVTHVRSKVLKRGPHKSALKYAKDHPLYSGADWVFITDVDEFLNIKVKDGQLSDLLDLYPEADAIPVCWRMFSNDGQEKIVNGLTTEALLDAELPDARPDEVGHFVKTLFKPNPNIERFGIHEPKYNESFAENAVYGAPWCGDGHADTPARPQTNYGYDVAQINHYAVRTVDSFLLKRDRGDGNATENRLELHYWKRWCRGGIRETSISRMMPGLQKELSFLKSDPVVRHLHEAAKECHVAQVEHLLKQPDYRELKEQILAVSPLETPADTPSVNSAARELTLKAPKRHQNRLRMLETLPKGGRGAEIGVWNGGFSEHILHVTQPTELVLIDPWDLLADQNPDDWTHKKHSEAEEMRVMRKNVEALYGSLSNVSVRQGFSAEVLASYPDNYFDWVYIDGNHLYDFVCKDLELSFRKVRPGGTIAGDDFFWKRNDRMHVKEAVLDTMRAQGMTNRPTRLGQQYMITVPE